MDRTSSPPLASTRCRSHDRRHPRDLGPAHVEVFLTHLTTDQHVSASTQHQALAAILLLLYTHVFAYTHVLALPLAQHVDFTRAKRPACRPAVLTQAEVSAFLDRVTGVPLLWPFSFTAPASVCLNAPSSA
ncbi:phage integrase N-terminal SAM-like domain-containing protein [Sorangium sp. So ce134]